MVPKVMQFSKSIEDRSLKPSLLFNAPQDSAPHVILAVVPPSHKNVLVVLQEDRTVPEPLVGHGGALPDGPGPPVEVHGILQILFISHCGKLYRTFLRVVKLHYFC